GNVLLRLRSAAVADGARPASGGAGDRNERPDEFPTDPVFVGDRVVNLGPPLIGALLYLIGDQPIIRITEPLAGQNRVGKIRKYLGCHRVNTVTRDNVGRARD